MKKLISVIMCICLLSSLFVFTSYAESALPESEHNYSDNFYGEWFFEGEKEAKGLLITFSYDTYVEFSFTTDVIFPAVKDGELTVGDLVNSSYWDKRGDFIGIYDGYGELVGTYDGYALAGQTVFVGGNNFTIVLSTDEELNFYGFKVTDVTPCYESDVSEITYVSGFDETGNITRAYKRGSEIQLISEFPENNPELYALTGWSDTDEGAALCPEDAVITADFDTATLYAKWVKVALAPEEVFPFRNSSRYFVIDGEDRYVMNKEDFRRLQLNLYKTFGPGPLPNPALSIVLATYPYWEWQGSCYGIAAVTALDHYGIIDVKATQGAENLIDMELDYELLSYINYYQAVVTGSFLIEDKAFITDNALYTDCLKNMFESVSDGNIVIFTFYEGAAFFTFGHTVLFTGAYTDENGNHVLIAYDCNYPMNYYDGSYSTRFMITPDFSSISYENADSIGAINWTDDFSQFKAFDIDGNTDTIGWYKALINHYKEMINNFIELLKGLFNI
ncbi:MAG: hypothetical protein IKB08_07805 [Clostridia bacterium]|nr:hypothetical protein [Clostridia bacterium]